MTTLGSAGKAVTNAVPAESSRNVDKSKPKPKLVRDSFTIPKAEYIVLESLKLRTANLARPTNKSAVLRAGIKALKAMNDKEFLAALERVPSLKTGRPTKAKDATSAK